MFFLALINNLFIRGITETLFRTFTFLIFTGASLVLANTFRRRKTLLGSAAYLFMVSAPPIIASEMSSRALGYDGDWIAVALITPIPAVVVYVLSLIQLMSKDREYVLDLLSTLKLSDSSFSSLNEKSEETALASYLHNSLQSELLALSVQLQNAAEKSDRGESEKLLQQVSSIVNRSIADDFSKFAESPLERLASLESSWRGLLSIEFLVNDEDLQNAATNLTIVQIVQEVATNVFRYDNATNLVIAATKNEQGLNLVLQSDGDGELVKGEGFGSRWFDQITSKAWTIEKNEIGTKIIFEL
jgi:signal transduction histidine kinase